MRFYTTEKISAKRERTPEGYLVCYDVPIARTGTMIYGPNEVPVEAGPDGLIHVLRDPAEVFADKTLQSFNGKSVVNEHPDDDVDPKNWKRLTIGVILNPRRGTGTQSDLLLADLLITDMGGISLIEDGKVELSCGYDAQYEEIGPGQGRQTNIVGNHVALVEEGRCGPRCSIGDQAYKGDRKMPNKSVLARALDRAMKAFRDGDEGEFKKAMDAVEEAKTADNPEFASINGGPEGQHIHIHLPNEKGANSTVSEAGAANAGAGGGTNNEGKPEGGTSDEGEEAPAWFKQHVESNNARFAAIEETLKKLGGTGDEGGNNGSEGASGTGEQPDEFTDAEIEGELKAEAPPGTEDNAVKAKDSAFLGDSFRDVRSKAEILAPGILTGFPTHDAKMSPVATLKQLCTMRRRSLDAAYLHPQTRALIDAVSGRRTLDTAKMSCGAIRTLFNAAAALKAHDNNSGSAGAPARVADHAGGQRKGPPTLAEINKRNADFWARQNAN